MPAYVMIAHDGPDGEARRAEYRAAHVAHLDALDADGRILFAGPIRNDANDTSIGAVIVFEAESLAEAKALVAKDPYVAGGVFARSEVSPFRPAYPKDSGD